MTESNDYNDNTIDIEEQMNKLMLGGNEAQKNELGNDISIHFKKNVPSSITVKEEQITSQLNTIKANLEILKEHKIPYTSDKIDKIKIKDEYQLESGINIDNYINSLEKFKDLEEMRKVETKFSKCEKCGKFNYYFCEKCELNMCAKCSKDCQKKKHALINLKEKINNYILEIRAVFAENCILNQIKKNKNEKSERGYEVMDEYELNTEVGENPMNYTSDITLIEIIIEKDYINYNHYINIIEIFNYMKKKFSLILLNYKVGKNEKKIKIFGEKFVEHNNGCKIIHEDKRLELREFFELKNSDIKHLEIILIGINKIVDLSEMFDGCSSLISIENISIFDTTNIKSMRRMFYGCQALKSIPDISNWDTSNLENLENAFEECSSLISLPNISNWDISKVNTMKGLFHGCENLKSLPDISVWETNNVKNMSKMFEGCSSLITLPDISKWSTKNVTDMKDMFRGCESLESFPDISLWDTSNVENMANMFKGCKIKPDTSNWNN